MSTMLFLLIECVIFVKMFSKNIFEHQKTVNIRFFFMMDYIINIVSYLYLVEIL